MSSYRNAFKVTPAIVKPTPGILVRRVILSWTKPALSKNTSCRRSSKEADMAAVEPGPYQERRLFDRRAINGGCDDWIIPEQFKNFVALLFIFGKGGVNEAPLRQSVV
jgi:hypothetical protein